MSARYMTVFGVIAKPPLIESSSKSSMLERAEGYLFMICLMRRRIGAYQFDGQCICKIAKRLTKALIVSVAIYLRFWKIMSILLRNAMKSLCSTY